MNRTGAQFNRVSGRKEHGAAVTAKVYTLGNSFELTGRDFYEKGRGEEQAIKENRLNANERRRRANRERARLQRGEKQHERAANHHAPQGRIVDRFGYQKRRTDGPGPTTAGFEAPRALPQRSRAKNNAVQRKKANVQRRQPQQEPDLTVNRPTVSSQRNRRKKKEVYNAESARAVRARVSQGRIGIALPAGEEREHATSLALARRMQRGGANDNSDDINDDYSPRSGRSGNSASRHRQSSSPRSAAAAYQQPKNTREPDEYLALLLGKTPQDGEPAESQSPRTSPGTVARARQLEKELARRRRLLELEQGLGDRIIARSEGGSGGPDGDDDDDATMTGRSPRSRQLTAAANRRGRQQKARNLRKGGNNDEGTSAAPFDTEPVARRINRRKEMERKKIQDGNVNRLIRAVKSGIVELQLCVWEWQKEKTFKSKDVARTRRVSLRRKLHRLLEDHRRSVVELVAALRHWQSERGMATFLWNDLDVMDLLRRMPSICGSSSDEAHGLAPGTAEAYESEFGLGFLGESDKVVGFLGFAVGDGDVVRRLDGTTDCNLFVLIPEDRIRAARLLGEDAEAEHLARSLLYGATGADEGDGDDDDRDDPEDEKFPFSCPEDMPLVCRLCHAGERTDDGRCPNCGHCGGDDWRELDAEARVQRFAEEREWFEEDKAENVRRKQEAKARKLNKGAKGTAKAIADIKYQPKISDRDLLRFAKVQRVVLGHQLVQLEATQGPPSPVLTGASKYGDEDADNQTHGGAYSDAEREEEPRQRSDEMEDEVEAQMMRRLRMMQERDGEENEYEQKEAGNDADDHGLEHAEEFPTGGIAEERSVYEGKYDQEDEAGVKAESPMPLVEAAASDGRSVAEEKGEDEEEERGEEEEEERGEEELTEIDREFAEMRQQMSVEVKADDPEEQETAPTISNFAATYYEDLKSDALDAAARGVKSDFRFVESKSDAPEEEAPKEEEELAAAAETPAQESRVIVEEAPEDRPETKTSPAVEATVEVEPARPAPLKKAVAFVVGGDEDVAEEPVRKAPVKKSVAFVVGADDEKDDSTYEGKTHHDGEAEDGDTLGAESKQAERPAMSEVLGEAEPVKQPTARERRMAALAAAERRAGKK